MQESAHKSPQSAIAFSLYKEVLGFVYAKVQDKAAAEDIVQDVFIKIHAKSSQLKEAEKITAWIFQIARNAVADHFRMASRVIRPINVDWEGAYHELNDCVSRCLSVLMSTLPDKYRIPLEMAELQDVHQLEIAKRLNITYSGARSRIQRARKMLKAKIDEQYLIKTDAYGNVITCEDRLSCFCKTKC